MHFSPESLLELFSPRRVAAMAALAMRARLLLPRAACYALQPRATAAGCCLMRPAAVCCCSPMPPLADAAAACCCVMCAVAACCTGAAARGPPCADACRAWPLPAASQRTARCCAAAHAPPLAGEEVFLVTVQHLEFNISTFYAFYFNISFVQFQNFYCQMLN